MAAIEFWFDYISPYAYLAWQRIHDIAERAGREVDHRPVLFAGLLNHWGQLGPAEVPPKRLHTFRQVARRAHARGVTLLPPPSHPFNPLLALRVSCVEMPSDRKRALIDQLFRATWGGGPGVAGDMQVRTVLSGAGFETALLLADAMSPQGKRRLRDQGEQAIARGVFGVPTVIADGELFWGDDSFDELEVFLRGKDPLDRAAMERWSTLPSSAQRRG